MWTSRALTTTKGVVAMPAAKPKLQPFLALLWVAALCTAVHAGTRTVQGLTPGAVRGLYATLRALRVHRGVAREIRPPGARIRSRLRVDGCAPVRDAWASSWSCTGSLGTVFKFSRTTD